MESLIVSQITGKLTKDFIRKNHYTRTCHNGPMGWGLFRGKELVGVCAFATPCSEAVRASLFGEDHKDRVTELHRLFTFDDLPSNAGTWFIARALRGLIQYRPKIRGIISFADTTEGHTGAIYKASNFTQYGFTGSSTFYRDKDGRLRHPRQSGVNITKEHANEMGWTPEKRGAKARFVKIIGPDRREIRKWQDELLLAS